MKEKEAEEQAALKVQAITRGANVRKAASKANLLGEMEVTEEVVRSWRRPPRLCRTPRLG